MAGNRAAWLLSKQARPFTIDSAPMPTAQADEIIIRVRAVAINPADTAIQTLGIIYQENQYPLVIGCDVAGEVVEVGSSVKAFTKLDRVIAAVSKGAFQLYCVAKMPIVTKLPDNVTFADGCVLPLGLSTAAVRLFEHDGLALPFPKLEPHANGKVFLVWGGASSVGSCAIQLIKASGFKVATTASRRNFDYCKALGADWIFDYQDADVAEQIITALQGNESAGAFCAVIREDALLSCASVVNALGGTKAVATVYPPPFADQLKGLSEGVKFIVSTAMFQTDTAKRIFREWLNPALANGTMQCKPDANIVGKGLEQIQGAMDQFAKGASAQKFVVEIP